MIEWLLIILTAFAAGYICGKRSGHTDGVLEAEAYAPLLLRQQSLLSGKCLVCGGSTDNNAVKLSSSQMSQPASI